MRKRKIQSSNLCGEKYILQVVICARQDMLVSEMFACSNKAAGNICFHEPSRLKACAGRRKSKREADCS